MDSYATALPSLERAAGALAPSALLLWLAGSLAARARAGASLPPRELRAISTGLAAAGVWWPLELAASPNTVGGGAGLASPFAPLLLAATVAGLATMTATVHGAWTHGRRLGAAAATLLLAMLCVATASGLTTAASGYLAGHAAAALILGGGLTLLAAPWREPRVDKHLRLAAALAVPAALLSSSAPPQGAGAFWSRPALWPTLALALFGLALLSLLRQRLPATRTAPRAPALAVEPQQDVLTGLPTRAHFESHLAAAVARCDSAQGKLALLFIDLDGFKPVNDTFGHSCGDRVLQSVGRRLKGCAIGGDVVARAGGDEFLMLIADALTHDAASLRARQVVEALSRPFEIEDRQVAIGCSIGIAFYPDSGQHAKLIARADAAMYAAKRAGGAGVCFYTPAMEADARERFDLLRDLRLALERAELELYYQPKIDTASGKVTAAEALLRWHHPTRGMVPPSVFIPIAERFGLIRSIGHWVIEDACRQSRAWQDEGLRMRVALNLSAAQMRQEDIVARIEGSLSCHRVDPSLLTCEITESVAMEDTKATQATFRELGAAGIHLSIDDFGTGYSSLAYLRKQPAEELKIDRSFVMDIEHSADARAVVEAVVKLAHALGLKVVAEGIENERQHSILVAMGCNELQGFLFARPMTASALLRWAMDERQEKVPSFAMSLFAGADEDRAELEAVTAEAGAFGETGQFQAVEHGLPRVH